MGMINDKFKSDIVSFAKGRNNSVVMLIKKLPLEFLNDLLEFIKDNHSRHSESSISISLKLCELLHKTLVESDEKQIKDEVDKRQQEPMKTTATSTVTLMERLALWSGSPIYGNPSRTSGSANFLSLPNVDQDVIDNSNTQELKK